MDQFRPRNSDHPVREIQQGVEDLKSLLQRFFGGRGLWIAIVVLVALYLASGFYVVQSGEKAYRQAEVLKGQGDAEATNIYADAYGKDKEFFSFLRHMDVYQKILGEDTTVLLRPDSPLMRYLQSPSLPDSTVLRRAER